MQYLKYCSSSKIYFLLYCGYMQEEVAVLFNVDLCVWKEVLMKHFRFQILKNKNNVSLFSVGLNTRPHLFSRVNYAVCHSNQIKLRWFTSASWTNMRQLMQKKYMYLQVLCFWFLTQENNEPGYRAGNFTDFIQSQVPSFKSLVMQITTLSSSSVWFLSSGSITAIYTAPCLRGVLLVWIFFLYIK